MCQMERFLFSVMNPSTERDCQMSQSGLKVNIWSPNAGNLNARILFLILVDRESRRSFDNFSANHDTKQGRTIITVEHFIWTATLIWSLGECSLLEVLRLTLVAVIKENREGEGCSLNSPFVKKAPKDIKGDPTRDNSQRHFLA